MVGSTRPIIAAEPRLPASKSQLAAMRRSGVIPGSLYGRAAEPISLQLRSRAVGEYLGAHGSGALLDLDLGGQLTTVVLREVDRDIRSAVIHVSFQRIALGDRIHAAIPLRFEGGDELTRQGLVLQIQMDAVELQGQADRLPETLTVDVRGCASGDVIHLSAISLPEGVSLAKDGSTAAAIVTTPRTVEPTVETVLGDAA